MKRAKNAETRRLRAVEEKRGLLRDVETVEPLTMHPLEFRQSKLAEALDLSIRFDGREVTRGVRFTVQGGERIALSGPNGCGKSSILKLIAGEEIPHGGTLRVANSLAISYVPQDMHFLEGSLYDYARTCGVDATLLLTTLRTLDFSRAQFEKDMRDFSAGPEEEGAARPQPVRRGAPLPLGRAPQLHRPVFAHAAGGAHSKKAPYHALRRARPRVCGCGRHAADRAVSRAEESRCNFACVCACGQPLGRPPSRGDVWLAELCEKRGDH